MKDTSGSPCVVRVVLSVITLCVLLSGCSRKSAFDAGEATYIFGPEKFVKTTGEREVISTNVVIKDPALYRSPFMVIAQNGDASSGHMASSASVFINDREVFKPSEFKKDNVATSRIESGPILNVSVVMEGDSGSIVELTVLGWLKEDLVSDIDGNIYLTVKIGGQVWMAENLRVTRFNDGSPIPVVTDGPAWYTLSTPAYCWYNNDSVNLGKTYGALYNYHAINSGKLAPEGWRIPTAEDLRVLLKHLDPGADFVKHEASTVAGGMLKEKGTDHWADPNAGATNETGFTALPGGCRSHAGNFSTLGTFGYFGATPDETSLALRFATGSAFMRDKISGYVGVSVRCVKEQ